MNIWWTDNRSLWNKRCHKKWKSPYFLPSLTPPPQTDCTFLINGWKYMFVIRVEDSLWWKITSDGRWPLMEDDLWWNTTFDGRQSLKEDDLWWKTIFDERLPLMEDILWWRITFNGRPNMNKFEYVCLCMTLNDYVWLCKISISFTPPTHP